VSEEKGVLNVVPTRTKIAKMNEATVYNVGIVRQQHLIQLPKLIAGKSCKVSKSNSQEVTAGVRGLQWGTTD